MNENKTENVPFRGKKSGRKPKINPAIYKYTVYLNAEQNAHFLDLFDRSGMKIKSHFIVASIFGKPIKVVKIDKAAMDYYMRLTTFHSQFRAIGVNYNQVVLALKSNFSEKKALALLYKLEQATFDLKHVFERIIALTANFEAKWLQK